MPDDDVNASVAETVSKVLTFQNAQLMIPSFNGNNMPFSAYRQRLENAKRTFQGDEQNIVNIAISKLQGKALEALDTGEPASVAALLSALKTRFGPRHPFSFYQGRISNLCKFPEEGISDYGARAHKFLRCATNAIKIERAGDAVAIEAQLKKDVVHCFLRGLPFEYSSILDATKNHATLQDAIDEAVAAERIIQDKEEVMIEMERERRFYKNTIATDERYYQEGNRANRRNHPQSDSEQESQNRRRNFNDHDNYTDNERYQRRTFYREERRPGPPQQQWRQTENFANQRWGPRNFPRDNRGWENTPDHNPRRDYNPSGPRQQVLFCRICNMNNHSTENCRRLPRGDGRNLVNRNNSQDSRQPLREFRPPFARDTRPQQGDIPAPRENTANNAQNRPNWVPNRPSGPGAIPRTLTQTNEPRRVAFVEKHQVLWQTEEKRDLPIVYATLREHPKNKIKMVVDTASGVNIIKISAVPEDYQIDTEDFIKIHGISPQGVDTLGSVRLTLFDIPSKYYVVADYLPLPADGLLGLEFLHKSQAQVSFYHQTVNFNSNPIKPYRFEKPCEAEIRVPPRSRMQTQLYVKNNLPTGYLPRVDLPDGIYAGESLVSNHKGICHTFIINTTQEEIRLKVPPQHILEYERLSLSETERAK